jgi:AbiV family abortive infection protein
MGRPIPASLRPALRSLGLPCWNRLALFVRLYAACPLPYRYNWRPMAPIDPDALKIIEACKSHARDLHRGAQILRDQNLPNVAYHLATLALEEIGKAQLIGMRAMSRKEDGSGWFEKQLDDHIKKLFWALWGRMFSRRPNRNEIDSLRNLATTIHENRLRGLYVPSSPIDFLVPKDAVDATVLEPLMALADARIAMEPPTPTGDYAPADLELLQWFSVVSDDSEKRKFLFSASSFDKMEELGAREWLKWLKAEIETNEAEARASLERELKRTEPSREEALEEKWQLKIRLVSQSHSIRPKDLKRWNERVTWVKLFPGAPKKNELIADFRLPKIIPLQGVWYVGLGYANTFVAALNIGTTGFFWWYLSSHTSTFYETLVDLENKMQGILGRSPELKIGWPHAALDSATLDRVVLCFAMMPQPDERSKHEPFGHYLAGIAFIAKTDVFLQFEPQAYEAFAKSLKSGMALYGHQLTGEDFTTAFARFVEEKTSDDAFKAKHLNLIKASESKSTPVCAVTLSEVAELKLICDMYFIEVFNRLAIERQKKESVEP